VVSRGRDLSTSMLAATVRLLPSRRGEWGRAMRAELAVIAPARDRWRFTLGCLRVVITQPVNLGRLGYAGLVASALTAVVAFTGTVTYYPLRLAVIGLTAVLLLLSWLGRRSGPLGPVAPHPSARAVRIAAHVVVAITTAELIAGMAGHHDNPQAQLANGVPIFGTVLAGYLVGFLAVTARRSTVSPRALGTAAGAGLGAAVVWLVPILIWPPIPNHSQTAIVGLVAAMLLAAGANSAVGHRPATIAALSAFATGAVVITFLVLLLSSFAPAALIPDIAPAALTPADDLAQSRTELVEPYLAVLGLGWLCCLGLAITCIAAGRHAPANQAADPVIG
jgi:hypothetical protein